MRREAMKAKMILKKGMVFLFAMVMVLTGIFSLGVMAASGLEGAYISPKSKMGLQYANNFSRDVSKSQVSVPNFMADSDTNSEEPNKSFNAQQVAAGNSDAGQKWRGFAAYAKNHDPSDFWVKYKNVTTANGKSVDLKIEVTDWKTQNDESKPLPSNGDMFGHDNNSAHLGYAIGFSYKKTGVVMFSGFKWVKFKYTFLYNGTNTKAPFTGFATFQDIDQNQYVTITDGTECISKASYIGGSDGNTWCEPDGWTYKAIKDQNASSDMGKDTFNKTCISLYVKDMTDMSIKYGWTGHTAIAYFDLAPWAMNSFEDNANPDVPKKLIQSGSSWISNEKTSAVAYKLGDTYSYRYEDTTPTYATDILSNLWNGQNKTAISSYVWEDTLDSGLSYVAGSLQVNVGGEDFTSEFSDSSSGQNIKFSATSKALANTSFYGKKVTVTFKVKIKDASYNWLGHERTADNKYRLIPNTAKRSMTYLKKLAYDDKKEVYTVTDGDYTEKGFVITIPKLYRGEVATIKLTCTAKEKSTYDSITDQWADCLEKANADKKLTCVNGEVIENRAFVTATLMLKDKDTPPDDLERVWVNTPHLNIKKSVEKKEYKVGETVKYTLVVTNVHEGTLARDIVITDQLQTPGETIVEGTIRLKDETGAVYDLGKKAGKDAEKPYLETQDDTSFKITTGMNLRYDGESPFKKLAEIDDKVHWKNKEGLTQEEWDAPITHTKFTVTYEAKINKEPADTNQFVNVATAKGSNTDEVKDDEIVYLKTPVIKTEKESDKDSYQKGETAKYHLTVTQTREDRTAVNVVIKDALKDEDSEKERIKGDTIKVYYNGNEFTPVSVKSDDTSFTIETGKNLTVKDKLEVTYDAEVLSDLNKDSITNIVKAKADNAYAEIELDVPVTKVTQNISARKTSNPASGTVVKQGGQIIYYIDVHNDSETTLKNVLVRDAIPELSNYVDGSASNDGKIMEINGKQYITYIIDTLRAGSTQTLSFAVTVDEKATSEDVILNTAEIKETTDKDLNEDGNIPDDLWNEDFKETNTTKHPLSNWATDIKTVKVGTPDSYIEKRADSAVYDVGETIHYTIVAEQTTKDGKLTNAVVEDKDLPDGVDIDYDSIKVDGNTVPEQDTMTSDTNSIYLIRTKKGFKVVYPELSEKSTITFDAVIKSEKLVGKKIPNKATIISDQTPEKEAVVNVKVPKNPVEKVIKKIINRKGVSGNSSPKGVKTGLSTHAGLFAGIAAALLAAAAILIKKRRNAKKKPMTLEKF